MIGMLYFLAIALTDATRSAKFALAVDVLLAMSAKDEILPRSHLEHLQCVAVADLRCIIFKYLLHR